MKVPSRKIICISICIAVVFYSCSGKNSGNSVDTFNKAMIVDEAVAEYINTGIDLSFYSGIYY